VFELWLRCAVARISSAVLVHANAWQRSFQLSMRSRSRQWSFDRGEAVAANGLPGDDAEEDLDDVQPRSRGRCLVHDSWVLGQPGLHSRVLAGAVVVADDVQLDPRS
jgi:hypothetical protein